MTATVSTTTTKRHPIRGFLYGIFFGLGLAFVAIGQGWAALGTLPPFVLFVVGLVVGTLWATYGPAKKPKGAPPAGAEPADEPTFAEASAPEEPAPDDPAPPDETAPDDAAPPDDTASAETAADETEPDEHT